MRQATPDILGDVLAAEPVQTAAAIAQTRSVNELRPHPDNEIIYGDRADSDLIESVRRLGVLDPILITRENLIVSGHRRWGAAIAAGLTHVPVIVSDASDDLDVGDLLVELNRNREKTAEQKIREANYRAENIRRRQSRQGQRTDLTSLPIGSEVRRPTEIAAEEVGIGARTFQRGKVVIDKIDELRAAGEIDEADALRDELNRSVNGAYNQVATDRPHNDLTEDETQAFLRRYFHPSTLARLAQAPDPREAARRHMVDSGSGYWGDDWRFDTRAGRVEVWDITHHGTVVISRDPVRHRAPDAIFTYERLAKMAMDLLPAAPTPAPTPAPQSIRNTAGEELGTPTGKLLIDWTDEHWATYKAGQIPTWPPILQAERSDALLEEVDGLTPAPASVPANQPLTVDQLEQAIAAKIANTFDEESYGVARTYLLGDAERMGGPDWQRCADCLPLSATWQARDLQQAIRNVVARQPEPVPQKLSAPLPAHDAMPTPVSQRDGYDSDEWYTPEWILMAARQVLGKIDLDPASCDLAQGVVQAARYWTRATDGLGQEWEGRVWLNPPYSAPDEFVTKLHDEYVGGNVRAALVLLNNATETKWFQLLLARFPVCFLNRRLAFWRHDHADVGARQGQAVFYLGPDVAAFDRVFSQHGIVVRKLG